MKISVLILLVIYSISGIACRKDLMRTFDNMPISLEEYEFIFVDYTCVGSMSLNNILWSGKDWPETNVPRYGVVKALTVEEAKVKETKLNSIIEKLPKYTEKVWRLIELPYELIDSAYVPGNVLEFKGFTSTTASYRSLGSLYGINLRDTNVLFQIKGKNGGKLGNYSWKPKQKEVIFKSKTKFKVISKTERGTNQNKKQYLIKLEEI